MKHLYTLLVPAGLLVVAALALLRPKALPDWLLPLVHAYPYVVLTAGLVLGWLFNRSRIVFALLILAFADRALLEFAGGGVAPAGVGRIVFHAIALLVPLNLMVFWVLIERGILNLRNLARLLTVLAQGLLVCFLCRPDQRGLATWLQFRVLDPDYFTWTAMPQPALVAFTSVFVLQLVRFARRPNPMESGYLWTLVSAFLALSWYRPGVLSTSYFATAGLVLIIALLEMSHRMAYHDELTGLPGRRALNEELLQLGGQYAVAMVDVDHFKRFNDDYGHHVGDQVLRVVGSKLADAPGGGRAFRYGGEEFAMLFPGKSVEDVVPHLETVRQTIEATPFSIRRRWRPRRRPKQPKAKRKTPRKVSVTVSIGVAEPDGRAHGSEQVIKAADKALYRAKEGGRNQVQW